MALENTQRSSSISNNGSVLWEMMTNSSSNASSVTLEPAGYCDEASSNFGDGDCGEPSVPQHLIIDFTPDPELDTLESQLKVCAFWDFVETQPCLKHLIRMPGPIPPEESVSESSQLPSCDLRGTAIACIEDHAHYINDVFDLKNPPSKCSMGSPDYFEEPTTSTKTKEPKHKGVNLCKCLHSSGACTLCNKPAKPPRVPSSPRTKSMCKQLQEWDKKHPKSMEPPGPVMQHRPVLQRKLPLPAEPKTCQN